MLFQAEFIIDTTFLSDCILDMLGNLCTALVVGNSVLCWSFNEKESSFEHDSAANNKVAAINSR